MPVPVGKGVNGVVVTVVVMVVGYVTVTVMGGGHVEVEEVVLEIGYGAEVVG